MTVGCKQAIELAVNILAKPNANVLLPKPGFPWDVVRSIYENLEVRNYEFLREKDYEIDLDSVRAAVNENTFAIFIINPHNPNGNTYSGYHLEQVYIVHIHTDILYSAIYKYSHGLKLLSFFRVYINES